MIKMFANYGCEKMFYDLRMGPQVIKRDDTLFIVYQANKEGICANPYIICYNIKDKKWSGQMQVGQSVGTEFDHHRCPVIWIDDDNYIHVLFDCHGQQGQHRVSKRKLDISEWGEGPVVAPSISYPHVFRMPGNKVCIYYRALGHMGFWAYVLSFDGGYNWSKPVKVVDFDQNPTDDADTWAGSYHSAQLDTDGHTLHVGFTYFDERGIWKFIHPRYHRKPSVNTRYNLYYLSVDLQTGIVSNINGDIIKTPINHKEADICKIWDSGDCLTMMPSIAIGKTVSDVAFLVPVTGETEWDCQFLYIFKQQGKWICNNVAKTNTTWSGSRIYKDKDGDIIAYLIAGKKDGSIYTYGAGNLEKWISNDNGNSWNKANDFVPVDDYLYNNPVFAEDANHSGIIYPQFVAFYGWKGPYSMQPVIDRETDIPIINRGMAFLLDKDKYI